MVALRKLPSDQELKRLYVDEGMTQKEIAQHVFETTGEKVTRSAVSLALAAAGLTNPVRYSELIPWRVKAEHGNEYPLRMLRAEARRRRGYVPPTPEKAAAWEREQAKLDAWLAQLRAENAVVHYQANTPEGFHYVEPRPGIDDDLIRVPDEVLSQQG